MSEVQWERLYRKAYSRMARALDGGGRFGYDWSTLRICEPTWYTTLRRILAMHPDRRSNA